MKSIPLKTFKGVQVSTPDGQQIKIDLPISKLIQDALKWMPQSGVTAAEVVKRMRVINAMEKNKSKTMLQLEDQDHATLLQCVSNATWYIVDNCIVEFMDIVKNAK